MRGIFEHKMQAEKKHYGAWLTTACIGMAWIVCVGAGVVKLTRYQMTPGVSAVSTQIDSTKLDLAKDRPTLLMFVHPQCPCSSASMEELARLMTVCRDHVAARVLFVNPSNQPRQWMRGDLWDSAQAIPGVEVRCDQDGMLAKRLNIQTSGHVLLFAPGGKLLFTGGITESRGHVGDNAGLSAVIDLIQNRQAPQTLPVRSSVFGCEIE
jgi:hypothetical protein